MSRAIASRYRKVVFALTLLCGSLASTAAHAVLIEVSNTSSFTAGSGYGVDVSETSSPTLLDVRFTATLANQSQTLTTVGQTFNFTFGTVQLAEPSAGGGIAAAETDNLGVMANFVLTSPLGGTEVASAVGSAVTGSVSDAQVDYTLTWTPLTVNFGDGGQLEISLATLSFTTAATQTLIATVKLLALPLAVTVAVPEPATLAVFAFGLVVLCTLVRRRRV